MSPPQLVHTLEVGVTQQPRASRERALAGSRYDAPRHNIMLRNVMLRNLVVRFSRHTGSHSDSNFLIAISRSLAKQVTGKI